MIIAPSLLAEGRKATVSDLVVAEAYFALLTQCKLPRKTAVRALSDFVCSGLIAPESGGGASEALNAAATSSQKPGFVDRLIHAQYLKMAGGLVSFEEASGKLEGAVVLKT